MERLCPRWQGQSLGGKTLIVHSEQGNGDDIQMVRFVHELAARVRDEGGRLVLAVRRALQSLFARFLRGLRVHRGRTARQAPLWAADHERAVGT